MKIILAKDVEKIKENFRCGACDGARCEHTLGCQALTELLSLAKEVDEKKIVANFFNSFLHKRAKLDIENFKANYIFSAKELEKSILKALEGEE